MEDNCGDASADGLETEENSALEPDEDDRTGDEDEEDDD